VPTLIPSGKVSLASLVRHSHAASVSQRWRQIETKNHRLISTLQELLDSQKYRLLEEGFKDTDD